MTTDERQQPTGDAAVSAEHIEVAGLLRHLGHSIVGRDVPDEVFAAISDTVRAMIDDVVTAVPRSRIETALQSGDATARVLVPPRDGEAMSHFPDCVVSGAANPMGIAISVRRDGDDAVANVTLGAAFEGAPGRAHGGVVAAIFDDLMGYQPLASRHAGIHRPNGSYLLGTDPYRRTH